MNPEIRRWTDNAVIIPEGKYASIKEAVEEEKANLSEANLSGANLSGAKMYGEIMTKSPIQISGLQWLITITEKHIQIGCEVHTADEWFSFDDSRIAKMHFTALDWWRKNKSLLKLTWENHVG